GRVVGGEAVQPQRGVADRFGQLGAAQAHGGVEVDVLVVVADRGLGGWGEDRFDQLLCLLQAVGQGDAADPAGALVILPAAADYVTARDALDRHRLEPPRDHRTPLVQRRIDAFGPHIGDVDTGQVVGDDVTGLVEPEVADLAPHFAL